MVVHLHLNSNDPIPTGEAVVVIQDDDLLIEVDFLDGELRSTHHYGDTLMREFVGNEANAWVQPLREAVGVALIAIAAQATTDE